MRASLGLVRMPLARITYRARMASPRSVVHGPPPAVLVPLGRLDGGVEQAVVVEAELGGHLLAVLEDLEPRGELHRRDVAHLLEQREVAVRLDVAGDARVAVPVPRAADVAALLAEADVDEPGLAQLVPQQQPGEPGADDEDVALVGQRLPRHRVGRVDVLEVLGELALHRHVVGGAPPGLLELAVLRLLLGVEHGARRVGREHLEVLVVDDRVALARDRHGRLGGPGVERLETGCGVDPNGHVLLSRRVVVVAATICGASTPVHTGAASRIRAPRTPLELRSGTRRRRDWQAG